MAIKTYTGILAQYNRETKRGSIIVDFTSDPLQPNIFINGNDLPEGFTYKDTKYESTIVTKTITDGKTKKDIGPSQSEVLTKDSTGKLILAHQRVSFNYNLETKEITNITLL